MDFGLPFTLALGSKAQEKAPGVGLLVVKRAWGNGEGSRFTGLMNKPIIGSQVLWKRMS
jgi:hypothetical protein